MKKKILFTVAIITVCCLTLRAQKITNEYTIEGRIITAPLFAPAYILMFSQSDYVYGTSRTAAMGGAFTSLGADLSAMNINPAGMGMYQSSDKGVTQSLSINSMMTGSNNYLDMTSGGTRVSYGLNNAAMAFNIFNHSKGLTSLTVGFGFNRLANFNSHSYVRSFDEKGIGSSIADMFYEQLTRLDEENVPHTKLDPSSKPFDNNDIALDEWAAVLAYQSGLVNYRGGGYLTAISHDASTDSYMQSITKGGIYEYSVSMGANINNVLYLGGTLTTTEINYSENLVHEEDYDNQGQPGFINGMSLSQITKIEGEGFTMKLGAIVRPIPSIRIGVALHLPTYYSVSKSFKASMSAASTHNSGRLLIDERKFNTAPRLLAGISTVIGGKAILAVDYECTWYNKIYEKSDFAKAEHNSKNESQGLYKPGQTFRAGFEYIASDMISLRAGGAYQPDFTKGEWLTNTPYLKSSYTISTGVGFNIGHNSYVDMTYLYKNAKYSGYDLYYFKKEVYKDGVLDTWDTVSQNHYGEDRNYTPKKHNHMITLTIGSRF